jgi:hypothetical protein
MDANGSMIIEFRITIMKLLRAMRRRSVVRLAPWDRGDRVLLVQNKHAMHLRFDAGLAFAS